ncbi:triose-phosphate isomerase [Caulobacter sp. S45]|uniref:triose-phosphate isomerase n=1 Tax=Caulobacter sp. S45 TaxID=1641861 RepID=UPI00131B47C1
MNGASSALHEAKALSESLSAQPANCRVALFPPAVLIHRMAEALAGGPVAVGAQDCHVEVCGAHTGDLSAEMLHEAGASMVILGHSERRTNHRESDQDIAAKVSAALRAGLEPIVCVGETLEEREAGDALAVIEAQVRASLPKELAGKPFAVAYEPVWAIGSGQTPTLAQVEEVHGLIHRLLAEGFGAANTTPVLYGGSVKPGNAAELMAVPGVDGALVGGASLKAKDFLPIVRAT